MKANTRIAFNSVIIFIRLCIVSVISLICSRLVLDALGASDFGLYNVVGGIVTLLNVVNSSMISTTYRFIAFELGKEKKGNINFIFNNSFIIHAVFSLLIITIGIPIGYWYITHYLNVMPGKVPDALFVFFISIATVSSNTLLVPFQGTLIAFERFSMIAVIDIISNIFKLGAIYFLIYDSENRLRVYSIIMFLTLFFSSMMYCLICKKEFASSVKIRLSYSKKVIKEMLGFATWTLFGACANIGKVQGSAIVINYFFGTVVNAAFAIANQVENFILMFSRTLNNAAIPQITKSFSSGDLNRSITLTSYISKYTFILMCLVSFPIILEIKFFLSLWLKSIPEGTETFCQLIIVCGLLDCLGAGIPALVNATGNIRKFQIILHTYTLLGIPLSILLFIMGFNPYYISIVYCFIVGTSAWLRLHLLKKIYHIETSIIIKKSYIKILQISIPLIAFYLIYNTESSPFYGHLLGIMISELFLFAVLSTIGLDSSERKIIKRYAHKYITK